jgi:hypothetical protein
MEAHGTKLFTTLRGGLVAFGLGNGRCAKSNRYFRDQSVPGPLP